MSHNHVEVIARQVARGSDRGYLATMMRSENGGPYASLALTAFDHTGAPMTLISDLAEHTKNIKQDCRASFLFERTAGLHDPLSGPRVTLLGDMMETDDPRLRERFFTRFPFARRYEMAHDFHLFRMEVKRAHIVAGFGNIHWMDRSVYLYDNTGAEALIEDEAGIVAHMNEDHLDALSVYAKRVKSDADSGWTLTGIDPEGLDLRRAESVLRLNFEEEVKNAQEARERLIHILQVARAAV